jgi:hypothetical protein
MQRRNQSTKPDRQKGEGRGKVRWIDNVESDL